MVKAPVNDAWDPNPGLHDGIPINPKKTPKKQTLKETSSSFQFAMPELDSKYPSSTRQVPIEIAMLSVSDPSRGTKLLWRFSIFLVFSARIIMNLGMRGKALQCQGQK